MSVPSALVIPVNELNFETEVLGSELPVLIDVSAAWCAPCRVAAPVVAALAERHRSALKVVVIDGDESPDLVARLGVRGFPTFLVFRAGEVRETAAGFRGAKSLEVLAARGLASASDA